MSKQDLYYFNNFHECALCSVEAANCLVEIIKNFDKKTINTSAVELHKVEHAADQKKHDMLSQLVRAFITPLERDDIIDLSQTIDNVVDSIEDVVININVTGVDTIRSDVADFSRLIVRCCSAMADLLGELKDFKKSKKMKDLIIEINNIEEEGDALYLSAMKKLHAEKNPLDIIAWSEIYRALENTCDACEDVTDIVERVIIGNL